MCTPYEGPDGMLFDNNGKSKGVIVKRYRSEEFIKASQKSIKYRDSWP